MNKHDYYADPTVFDRINDLAQQRFGYYRQALSAHAWPALFAFLSFACFLAASGMLSWGIQLRWLSGMTVDGAQVLGRGGAVILALFAAVRLLKLSVQTVPEGARMHAALRRGRFRVEGLVIGGVSVTAPLSLWSSTSLGSGGFLLLLICLTTLFLLSVLYRSGGFSAARPVETTPPGNLRPGGNLAPRSATPARRKAAASGSGAAEFLGGVKAAGVNVSIAKALYKAGIRSARHLAKTDDTVLLKIHGVGPASIRKLRAYFTQSSGQSGSSQSS